MIVRSSLSWFRLLFVWHGSVLPRILPRLLLVLLIALLAASLRHWWLSSFGDSHSAFPPLPAWRVAGHLPGLSQLGQLRPLLGGTQAAC
jgi:hypothetical protein